MNRKTFIVCAMFFASVLIAGANPITFKEIAMLLRNGERSQAILDETSRRKLLQPLSPREEADLISLGATATLVRTLRTPSMLATPETAAAYQAGLLEQQRLARQRQKEADLRAMQPAATPENKPSPPVKESGVKPMDLKFTAIDGTQVDLANLRGKVVLINFWASWCGPAMMGVPDLVAAYNKYHDQGFEIIGISLDQNKEAVLKTIRANDMTWPEYFDGKGWKNEISLSCNIHSLPVMWLVDKTGALVSKQARGNLDEAIEKLLAE